MAKIYKNIKDLFKDLEKDIKKNPNKYLDDQAKKILVGQKTIGICPKCNTKCEAEILKHGKAKCFKCGNVFNYNIEWDVKLK